MAECVPNNRAEFIERLLECAICLERFNDPRLLPCQHTFCHGCLSRIADFSINCLSCPSCRQTYELPAGCAIEFPANLTIKAFLELPPTLPESGSTVDQSAETQENKASNTREVSVICEQCKLGETALKCFHCNKSICSVCRLTHRHIVQLEIKNLLAEIKETTTKVSTCLLVLRSKAEFISTTTEATKEQVAELVQAFCKELQEQGKQLISKIDVLEKSRLRQVALQKEKLEQRLTHLQDVYMRVTSKMNESEGNVSDQDLMNVLDTCAQQVGRKKVTGADRKLTDSPSLKRQSSAKPKRQGQPTSRSTPKTRSKTNRKQGASEVTASKQSERTSARNERLQPRHSVLLSTANTNQQAATAEEWNPAPESVAQPASSTIHVAKLLYPDHVMTGDNEESIDTAHVTMDGHPTPSTQKDLKPLVPFSWTEHVDMETEEYPTSGNGSPNHCTNVTSDIPSGIIVRAIIGKRGSRFWNPSALSISPLSGIIVVVDSYKNCLQVLDKDGHFLTQFGAAGSADAEFDYPHSCFCTHDENIIVTDAFNHRVQVFTKFGQFLRKFGHLGSEQGELEAPSGVGVDSKGYVYVSDTNNCRIQIFTQNGAFVDMFGTPETLPQNLHRPQYSFLTISASGDVFVSDKKNHCIHKFNSTRQYQWSVGGHGSEFGQFRSPRGLAVDYNGRLLVTDRDNHRIQVFRADGEFLYSFGSHGDRAGQFHGPEGIAAAGSSHVAVAECGGQRVQMFSFV